MLSLPMLTRELRAIARAPGTYRLRLLVGAVGIGILLVALEEKGSGLNRSSEVFKELHKTAFVALMVLTPLLTADTISKEKREGTLDLLYLTSLSAAKVVAAKFSTQFIRIVSIWALLIPLSVVPVLSGGVSAGDVMFALSVEFSIILVALVAGLAASAIAKRAVGALFLAIAFSITLLWLDVVILYAVVFRGKLATTPSDAVVAIANIVVILLLTPLLLLGIARILSRQKAKAGPSARSLWFRNVFLTPRFWRRRFQRTMSLRMDRNPLIWLEYRTAWSRVARSILVGALILCESLVIMVEPHGIPEFHRNAALVLLGLLAVTASMSFQREKENGAFELLLVAPFTETSLISGRLRAVWSYYAPVWFAFALLVAVTQAQGFDWYDTDPYSSFGDPYGYSRAVATVVSLVLSTLTIPIAGLYFALRLKHFLPAVLATAFAGFVVPMFLPGFVSGFLDFLCGTFGNPMWALFVVEPYRNGSFPYTSTAFALHTSIAVIFAFAIHSRLKARTFG
jgi:ABC-type transport system involved in multi-copper enzyme maturation permease subunit